MQDLGSLARDVAVNKSNPMVEQQMLNKVVESTSLILARAMCDPDGMVKNHDFDAVDSCHESHNPPVPYNKDIMVCMFSHHACDTSTQQIASNRLHPTEDVIKQAVYLMCEESVPV